MPEKQLVMVGNWENGEYGSRLREKYSKFSNIHMLDPIYESHTINWIRSNAAIYVHGHSAGGTNPSLVEAMNFGLPILAFDCIYNRSTTADSCLYWYKSEDLCNLIKNTSNENLYRISLTMKDIGCSEYLWKIIASKYNDLY